MTTHATRSMVLAAALCIPPTLHAQSACPGGEAIQNGVAPITGYAIPASCTKLQIKAWGAGGGRGSSDSGGGGGFAFGRFTLPSALPKDLVLWTNGPDGNIYPGRASTARIDYNSTAKVVVVAAGGGAGGFSGSVTPAGRGGAAEQAGDDVQGTCNGLAHGGGAATATAVGPRGEGPYPGHPGNPPHAVTQVGDGGYGADTFYGGGGSQGHFGGGGGAITVGKNASGACGYLVGAGGGGGSNWISVDYSGVGSDEGGVYQVPGGSGDPDRSSAGNGETPGVAPTGGRIVARWRGPNGFFDVSPTSPYRPSIEKLACNGITTGCGNDNFCPSQSITREQMAPWLLLAKEGSGYTPPACTGSGPFNDVPCSSPYAKWIQELAARGITGGCGGGNYCPTSPVTREQMAVFLLLTKEGSSYSPPPCTGTGPFNDVPCSSPYAKWIQEIKARGISGGCGGNNYCPTAPVPREQMAVFLDLTFGLPACP